jgi:predicted enzyme related to lactoylglutathione lyase
MTKTNPVGWFEIPVNDMSRAIRFYETVFKRMLHRLEMPGQEMVVFEGDSNLPNCAGALVKIEGLHPQNDGTMVYFSSEDVNNEVSLAEQSGGKVMMPKTSIGQWGFIAHLLDTEGNRIGVHSQK